MRDTLCKYDCKAEKTRLKMCTGGVKKVMVENNNGIVSNLVKWDKFCEIGIKEIEKTKSGIYNLTQLKYNTKLKAGA